MNVSVNCLNRHSKQFLSDFLFCGITLQYFPLLGTYFLYFSLCYKNFRVFHIIISLLIFYSSQSLHHTL